MAKMQVFNSPAFPYPLSNRKGETMIPEDTRLFKVPEIMPIGNGQQEKRIALTNTDRHFLSSLLRYYHFLNLEPGSGNAEYVKSLIFKIEQ